MAAKKSMPYSSINLAIGQASWMMSFCGYLERVGTGCFGLEI